MNSEQILKLTTEFAPEYDKQILNTYWKGPEVIFDLLKDYIRKGDTLLDIGIGTGLASLAFHKAGLNVYGIDGSAGMLEICESKKFAKELILTDITKADFELPGISFNFIISNAVFHFFNDMLNVIEKATSQLKSGGYICFTVIPYQKEKEDGCVESPISGVYQKLNPQNNLIVYRHTNSYVKNVLSLNKLQLIKNQIFLAFIEPQEKFEVYFEYYLAVKG